MMYDDSIIGNDRLFFHFASSNTRIYILKKIIQKASNQNKDVHTKMHLNQTIYKVAHKV